MAIGMSKKARKIRVGMIKGEGKKSGENRKVKTSTGIPHPGDTIDDGTGVCIQRSVDVGVK